MAHMTVSSEECCSESSGKKTNELVGRQTVSHELAEQSDECCGKNGICSHEVLQDGEPDRNSTVGQNKMMRKVCCRLALNSYFF